MERLTQETPKGASLIINEHQSEADARKELMQKFRLAVESLAAYERTGLTPADIASLQAENQRLTKKCDFYKSNYERVNGEFADAHPVIADMMHERDKLQAELADLRGQIERGEMVRVVRCKECESSRINPYTKSRYCDRFYNANVVADDHFCALGTCAALTE